MSKTKSRSVTIRIDCDLYNRIVMLAKENTRTFNLEVQALLKKGVARHDAEQAAIKTVLDADDAQADGDDSGKQQKILVG